MKKKLIAFLVVKKLLVALLFACLLAPVGAKPARTVGAGAPGVGVRPGTTAANAVTPGAGVVPGAGLGAPGAGLAPGPTAVNAVTPGAGAPGAGVGAPGAGLRVGVPAAGKPGRGW